MNSGGIKDQDQSCLEKKKEINAKNLFSDLDSGYDYEEHQKRNSLNVFSLNELLKDDFAIFDKREDKESFAESTKNRYKSLQLSPNDLKGLDNFIIKDKKKNEKNKNKLNEKLESFIESSNNKEKEKDENRDIDNTLNYDKNNLCSEPEKRQMNNIKKIIQKNGKIKGNYDKGKRDSEKNISDSEIQNIDMGSENNFNKINIETEIEDKSDFHPTKSELNEKSIPKKQFLNNPKNVDQGDSSNNQNPDHIEMKKLSKKTTQDSLINKIPKNIDQNSLDRGSSKGKKDEKFNKTHFKSSSISVTSDRSSINSISNKITDSSNPVDRDKNSRIINKKSSMINNLKNNVTPRTNEDYNKPNNKNDHNRITTEKKKSNNNFDKKVILNDLKSGITEKNEMGFIIQTPVTKKSSTLSAKPTQIIKKKNRVENTHTIVKEKERENLNRTSEIIKNFEKPQVRNSSNNLQITLNKNQKNQNVNTINYNTTIIKRTEKQKIKSIVNKTSYFSLSEMSSTLKNTKSKINYSPDVFCLSENESKTTRAENSNSSLIKFKTSKHFNKASSLPKNISPLLEIKESKNELTVTREAKQLKNLKANIQDFYNREMDYLDKRKKKIEEMAEISRKKELENVLECPPISKISRKIAEKNTNDFYTRQITFSNRIESKLKEKVEEQNKKEAEMIDKFHQKYKGKKVDMNLKYDSLVNWKKQKIEVIKEKQKNEYDTQIKKCSFKPTINKNSQKISGIKRACDSNTAVTSRDTVSRLYKEETLKRKHKNEILMNIYTPTFSPIVYNNKINFGKNYNQLYTLTNDNNQLNNSFNNNLNNTTCNTITGFQTVACNPRNASACGVKDYDRYKNKFLHETLNSNSSNNGNKNFNTVNNTLYENVSINMKKFKSQNRYINPRENSAKKDRYCNDFNSYKDEKENRMNSSFQSEKNGDGKGYYKSFFTEAAENPRDLGNMLKERFQNVFKKYI